MANHEEIYKKHSDKYEALISKEDYKNNLLPAIKDIIKPQGLDIIDLGAGTGRLTALLIPYAKTLKFFDLSFHMLEKAVKKLKVANFKNWIPGVADHRHIPLKDNTGDMVISGWSISYLIMENDINWKEEFDRTFNEIKRLVRSGGTVIIIESMGTGKEKPELPNERLADYYKHLKDKGFSLFR